jgi:hypothetical protein
MRVGNHKAAQNKKEVDEERCMGQEGRIEHPAL